MLNSQKWKPVNRRSKPANLPRILRPAHALHLLLHRAHRVRVVVGTEQQREDPPKSKETNEVERCRAHPRRTQC